MEREENLMREEEQSNETKGSDTYLVEALKKAKENSVSREEYDKLLAQNKMLAEAYTEGRKLDGADNEPQLREAKEIREDLFGTEHNNLDGWKLTLELREAVLKEEGKDIFIPEGHNYNPTDLDFEKADNVAKVIGECIEQANGNNEDFTAFLMSRTKDVQIPMRKKR